MLINIVPIGNSKGIRIPKSVLDQCHMENEVVMEIEDDRIILKPVHTRPREDWAEQFSTMHEKGEDDLLIDDAIGLDAEAWEW